MNLDQKIQLAIALGTWSAAIATFGAVVVSLCLATRGDRVRLRCNANILHIYARDGSPPEETVGITVANLGERPVTINSVSWKIGKGKKAKYGYQVLTGGNICPAKIAHGEQAQFTISLQTAPTWANDLMTGFVEDGDLRTLRALVNTSVGEAVEVVPAESVLKRLREARRPHTAA